MLWDTFVGNTNAKFTVIQLEIMRKISEKSLKSEKVLHVYESGIPFIGKVFSRSNTRNLQAAPAFVFWRALEEVSAISVYTLILLYH